MRNWKQSLISPQARVREAIQVIDNSSLQVAFVVDEQQRLQGMITDRDVRRGLLRQVSLDDAVQAIMNPQPQVVRVEDNAEAILEMFARTSFRHLPVLDQEGRLVRVEFSEDQPQVLLRPNPVVLMAGGTGSRLRPLTNECPKPLLKVGNRPILETILESFIGYGFQRFYFSVNYKAEMIQAHFGDGSRWNVKIEYLQETEPLGTAGALGLLPEVPQHPLIVMNGDLLTKVNFLRLLEFHKEHQAWGTMCVREYDFQVPYGVVKLEHQQIIGIDEKPVQRFFVNAGVYVLDPGALALIPSRQFFDMPTLFDGLIRVQRPTLAFPIREYWLDIGQMEDFKRANGDFFEVFG